MRNVYVPCGTLMKFLSSTNMVLLKTVNAGKAASSYPLKGGKHTNWQGGVRVNAFVSGGFLPQAMRGQKTEGYIHIADWYATLCALAGVDPTDKQAE